MGYCVPVLMDSNYEMQGLFSVNTTSGAVVVVTEKGPRFADFIDLVSKSLQGSDQVIGFVELEVESFALAVRELIAMDPSLANNALFIQDDEPLFDNILDYFRSLASGM